MSCNLDLRNMDCMELMAQFPDKHFELAIVDPPYGIDIFKRHRSVPEGAKYTAHKKGGNWLAHKPKKWDNCIPDADYFAELFRVSKNQIIWGANYLVEHLPPSKGWIVWHKLPDGMAQSKCELAFSSFDKSLQYVRLMTNEHIGFMGWASGDMPRIHPTQKPVALYKWLLKNYAKEGDKILDTHLGSGSIAIACWDGGFDLTGSELDTDYFAAMQKRIANHTAQGRLAL